jgi:hypothetical protein
VYFRIILSVLSITICFGADEFSISGRTVDGGTGHPIKNVLVELSCLKPVVKRAVLTDVSGAFRFEGVSACRYQLGGQKPSYERAMQVVQLGPSGKDVVLKLNALGVIRGRVSTTEREPAIGVIVRLWHADVVEGRRQFRSVAYGATDDRGEYLLPDLLPGSYVLHAAGKAGGTSTFVGGRPRRIGEEEAFAPLYYGGTSLPTAAPITVESGKELRADLSVAMRPAYAISGTISGMTPYQPVSLLLLTPDLTGVPTRNALNSATGEFWVADVVPGSYLLRATQRDGKKYSIAEVPLTVTAGAVQDVRLLLAQGVDVPVNLPISSDVRSRSFITLSLTPVTPIEGGTYNAFAMMETPPVFKRVVPGRYRFGIDNSTVCVQSVTAGSQNLLLEPEILVQSGVPPAPIDIVVSELCGSIEAKLPDGMPLAFDETLVLFPASGGQPIAVFLINKAYTRRNLRPGDYTAYLFPKDVAYAERETLEKSGVRGQPVKVQAEGVTRIQLEVRP